MLIAFYAPLKSPRHPTPSGDRSMARLFVETLEAGGHQVEVISDLRSLEAAGDREAQMSIEAKTAQEVARLKDLYPDRRRGRAAPDLWFTYHHYYKAPDLLGPELARAWGIPYVIAEASHAPKRLHGPWADWADRVERTIRQADLVLSMTRFDHVCLAPLIGPGRLTLFPPFLKAERFLETPRRQPVKGGLPRLLSVAMMRPGDKTESYRRLAQALGLLQGRPWHLMIAGDGPARPEIEDFFQAFPEDRVEFLGTVGPEALPALYAQAGLFLWPGAGEAYGMVYLEAAASGLAVVAQDIRGVPDVVKSGQTGLLTGDNDQAAYGRAIAGLLDAPEERRAMGDAGRQFIRDERDLPRAAVRLNDLIGRLEDTP